MRIDATDLAGCFSMKQGCGSEKTGKDSIHSLMKAQIFIPWQDAFVASRRLSFFAQA
jgi:hypothetical protein